MEFLLFWLPRIAVAILVLTGAIWIIGKGVMWFAPQAGDQAPQFEVVGGSSEQNTFLVRLLRNHPLGAALRARN